MPGAETGPSGALPRPAGQCYVGRLTLKSLQDRAWLLLFIVGLAVLGAGIIHLYSNQPVADGLGFVPGNTGLTWDQLVAQDPGMATAVLAFQKLMAGMVVVFALLYLGMLLTAYRQGQRWAWFAAWLIVVVLGGFIAAATAYNGWTTGPWHDAAPWSFAIQFAMILLGLFLPFRKFFPRAA